jgi:tRNA (cmo5U34)-methyltransferase
VTNQTPDPSKENFQTANAPEGGPWTFDESVTASFEMMLRSSIPNYQQMRQFTTEAAVWACKRMGGKSLPLVVDLGASRGSALQPIVDRLGAYARYHAAEISEPMLAILRDEFGSWEENGLMKIQAHDLREGYPREATPASVIMSILTLQFVPIEYRQRILREAVVALRPGGIMIIVEKVLGSDAMIQEMLVDVYHDHKMTAGGYSREAVDRKRLSLEGVLVPLTASFNEQMFLAAGFQSVDTVWGWGSFRGWVCCKG